MCAILDANVAGQVFGAGRPAAGAKFFEWIHSGRGRLVLGGRLRRELDRLSAFREWRRQAELAGKVTLLNDEAVDGRATELAQENALPLGRRARRRGRSARRGASAVHERRRPAGGFQEQGSGR